MSRLRLLLFCLLVLAVPLQGFAATSKLLCDSARGPHGHAAHGQQHVGAQHVHAASVAVDAGAAVAKADAGTAAHQCGLCAACCHAVAIAHAYEPVFASPAPQAAILGIAMPIPSRGVRLPEKPPRA